MGQIALIEAALSITGWGRMMIGMVNKYLKDKYNAGIVYGDTDSSMVIMPDQIKHPSEMSLLG